MPRLTLWSRTLIALLLPACAATPPAKPPLPPAAVPDASGASGLNRREQITGQLLAQMTLAEKLGQLTQSRGGRSKALNSLLDDGALDRVRQGRVGSYLHVAGAESLHELQRVAVEESRLHVPLLFGMDVVHGYRTIFPVPLAQACSFDPLLVERAAAAAAREATAAGVHWTFAPMVDIARDPRWGRVVEGAGEDPYLGSVLAAAQVHGYQGSDLSSGETLVACPKHFVGYGAALGGRDYASAELSPRTLASVYLPPFRAAIAAGAGSLMVAFNDVAGIPMTAHESLLRELLRERWGFYGVVLSDWNAIAELIDHGVAATRPEAGALALRAGVDMDMTSGIYAEDLARALEQGLVGMGLVDDAVRRVLELKFDLGLFDDPYRYGSVERERQQHLSRTHVELARDLAGASIVLLKNEGALLPLRKTVKRLAVIGPLADHAAAPLGSWKAQGRPEDVTTIRRGIEQALGEGTEVGYAPGCDTTGDSTAGFDEAERVARGADVVVLVVGEDDNLSGEARSRSSLGLPGVQSQLADRVLAAGRPTVVVVTGGRPLAVEGLAARAPALVQAWLLGVQMGPAVADVLFGDRNPGGKLAITLPRSVGQVPIFYADRRTGRPASEDLGKDTSRYRDLPITPLFPFGHGLSYTEFQYSDLQIEPAQARAGEVIVVRLSVKNVGMRAGDEVVQLYVSDPVAGVARPRQELVSFTRLRLERGHVAVVEFAVPVEMLGYYDRELEYVVEPGQFRWLAGSSSADIRLRGETEVVEELRGQGEPGTVTSRVRVSIRGG